MSSERFDFYISGGNPEHIDNSYEGCRDDSAPVKRKPAIINHELYFAKESPTWSDQGVAFIKPAEDKEIETYARKYLIKREQLEDVAKQETSSDYRVNIDFDAAIENGWQVSKSSSWYGLLMYLGSDDGDSEFTITNEEVPDSNKPGEEYLNVLIEGLRETHDLSSIGIVEYLRARNGIDGNYLREELTTLL